MESPLGHVLPGLGFFLVGLWHLFNNIKLFCLNPNTFSSSPWFPYSKLRYLEPYSLIISLSMMIVRHVFIGPKSHHPFDADGTIPSTHLRSLEHASISMSFIVFSVFTIIFDRARPRAASAAKGLTFLALAAAFAQQFFLIHLHSVDNTSLEGQYHLLFQYVIFVSLFTTLMSIAMPNSFFVSFVRSSSVALQGAWLMVIGFMLFTTSLIPKDCFFHIEKHHQMVRCSSEEALHRAKSLANIEFSFLFVLFVIFIMTLYLVLDGIYGEKVEYSSLTTTGQSEEDDDEQRETESLKNISYPCFVQMGKLNI